MFWIMMIFNHVNDLDKEVYMRFTIIIFKLPACTSLIIHRVFFQIIGQKVYKVDGSDFD